MPELPEVETVRAGLACLEGATASMVECRRSSLRYALPENFAARIQGRRLERVERVAKYLLLRFDDQGYALVHLGMSGQCLVHNTVLNQRGKHDHIIVDWREISGNSRQLVYRDPRRFGYWDLLDNPRQHAAIKCLGREAIFTEGTAEFARERGLADAGYLFQALSRRRQAIKQTLLDQAVIAGLGNIYTLEALWRAGIHPASVSSAVPREKIDALAKSIDQTLRLAINAGGSTLRDFVGSQGEGGYFQHDWQVYQREGRPCAQCGATVTRQRQGGRSSFFCSRHQQLYT